MQKDSENDRMVKYKRYIYMKIKYLNEKNKLFISILFLFLFFITIIFIIQFNVQLKTTLYKIIYDLHIKHPEIHKFLVNYAHILFSIGILISILIYLNDCNSTFKTQIFKLTIYTLLLTIIRPIFRVWYVFFICIFVVLFIIEMLKTRLTNASRKYIEFIKRFICLFLFLYYHLWNYFNNEPLTNFVRTPDFIPPSLCDYSNSSKILNNFNVEFTQFVNIHNMMIDKNIEFDKTKFIIYRASLGLGNRLQGLLSSFLVSILLKRAFLVDWKKSQVETYASLNDLFEVHIYNYKYYFKK